MKALTSTCRAYSTLLILVLVAATSAQPPYSLTQHRVILIGSGLDEPYQLPDSLLIEGSETINFKSSQLPPEAYQLDALHGSVRFTQTFLVTDTLIINYRVFPFALRTSYFYPIKTLLPTQLAQEDTAKPVSTETPVTAGFDTGALRKSGTLVRGVTIGTGRDLTVESGLNLQVEGRLGRDVDVLALLSDQNTPLQPEGNTATLQEIDKVLIQVQSTHFDATLGDYELQLVGSRYAGYYRKLQGARLDGRTTDDQLTLSGAVSKGQYHSNSFLGQEGNQGPYRLTDKEGRTGILVLAGTERVYLDGVLLSRGENNDYTIEYGLGEITFTPRRLITSDSRLTVDFQYSADVYGRDIYAMSGLASFWSDRLKLRTTLISESEARNRPLSFVLTDSARAALTGAGDDPTQAQLAQVDSVAIGEGSYIRAEVLWGGQTYSVFQYVGWDSIGYLNVAFSYVGQGQGDYERVASANGFYYNWAGPNEGGYAPVQRLPLPERRRLADIALQANPNPTTQFKLEGAVSEWDRNTFSTSGDGDNVGFAWAADGHWQSSATPAASDFAKLALDANLRRQENRFTQIDRVQDVEYSRQWDLDVEGGGEAVQEATLSLRPFSPWDSKIGYGYLQQEETGFRSERWRGETHFAKAKAPTFSGKAEWIRSNSSSAGRQGMWTRGMANATYPLWRLIPSLTYEREHKRDDLIDSTAGFLFQRGALGLIYQRGKLTLGSTQELREDQKYQQGKLRDFSAAQTQNYNAKLSSWRNLSGEALFTHRSKSYEAGDSAAVRTDLMQLNFGWTPWQRTLDLAANYRINNTRVSSLVQIPVFVGSGQGTHVKVGEQFYQDPDGDYVLITQSTGDFQPVVELEGSLSLELDPHRLPDKGQKLPKPFNYLASQTLLNFNEKTKERDVWSLYRLDLVKFQGDSTLSGNVLLREDLFLFRHSQALSFRLRSELSQSLSNLYLSGGQETRRRLLTFRVRRAFNERWSLQLDLSRETELREYRSTNTSSRDVSSWSAALEPIFRPSRAWELGLRGVAQKDLDRVEQISATRYGLEPRLVRNFMQKGRGELRVEWHHVATAAQQLPYEMAEGDPPGDNFRWDLRFDYRVSKYLTASLSYNGSKDANREAIHIGKAEVRAFF